jgi:hypothetical protein
MMLLKVIINLHKSNIDLINTKKERKSMKNTFNSIVIGIAIIICVSIMSTSVVMIKMRPTGAIQVTGSATRDFESDLIVWRGSFSERSMTTKEAYTQLKNDADAVKTYLVDKGVPESEIVFSSIEIMENYDYEYNVDGSFRQNVFKGYTLTQRVTIESKDVDRIEVVSRDITELIDSGVDLLSMTPEYYYTKLDELKIEMIADASQNARIRAEQIAANSGGEINKLTDASLGVFQIIAQNSSEDAYSYGGAFNVSSKYKTASITARLNYSIK